jgi:NitT/TauT family transport system substrate-binding protein
VPGRRGTRAPAFAGILAAFVALAVGCGGSEAGSGANGGGTAHGRTKVTLRLDWVAQGYQAPFYVALGRGFYKQAGLDVDIRDGRGTSTTIKTVANGSDTFGFGQLSEVALAIANHGLPLEAVAGVFQQMPDAIFARRTSGITSARDLVGKEVISSAGDSTRTFFPAVAAANGFDADKVKFLNVSSESKTRAFVAGRGDAMLNFASEAFAVRRAKVDAVVLRYADLGVNVISQGLFTKDSYVDQHADVVRRFVQASMRGLRYARDHPRAAAGWVLRYRPGAETAPQALFELQSSLPLLLTRRTRGHPLGYMAPADWAQSVELLARFQGMKRVAADRIFTNQFVGR